MREPETENAGRSSDASGATGEPQVQIELAIRGMLDRTLPIALALGAVATTSSTIRSLESGWRPVYTLHWGLLFAGCLLYAFRRRISFRVFGAGLLAIAGIDGVANMLTGGLAANGLLVLGCSCVLAGLMFGRRGGLTALGLTLAAWCTVAVLITSGVVPIEPYLALLTSRWAWLANIAASSLFVLVVLVATYGVQERLLASLREHRQRQGQLENSNDALEREAEQRRRAEAELAEREQKYRLLAENMTDALFVQDMQLNVIYASPSAARLFGGTIAEVVQKGMAARMTPASLARALEAFQRYVARAREEEEIEVPLMEYEYVRMDGSVFWGELRVAFLRGPDGELTGSQGILRDVTERKRAEAEKAALEEKLRQSEKMQAIGQLAGGIAHDFNNQLTGIMMGSELLRRELADKAPLVRYVDFIRTAATRSSDLTMKLLAFSRKDQLVSAPTDVHALTQEVVSILERSVDKAIALDVRLGAEEHVVLADAAQLQNALLNVALNARDALPGSGRIQFLSETVSLRESRRFSTGLEVPAGTYLRLTIRDDGVGMDEATMARIFEPFFTTKERSRGTGLGLSTTYGCIESLGGGIDVDSARGEGCSMSFYLPALRDSSASEHAYDAEACERGIGTILLVEDEEVVRESVRRMLERLGYQVEASADGEQAIRAYEAQSGRFDAVVLDVVLPKLGGDGVLDALRKRDPELPVLVMSGYSPEGVVAQMLRRPRTTFVQKPFSSWQLAGALDALLRED